MSIYHSSVHNKSISSGNGKLTNSSTKMLAVSNNRFDPNFVRLLKISLLAVAVVLGKLFALKLEC